MSVVTRPTSEAIERFACFGGSCGVLVEGAGPAGSPQVAVELAKRRLLDWHAQFSRFEPASELSRLNRDPRPSVPVSAMMVRFVEAALRAATITGGLVDPTLVTEVEQAGYAKHFTGAGSEAVIRDAGPRRPAARNPAGRWRQVSVDRPQSTITRPPGVRLDSGGVAKGLFGDVLAAILSRHHSFAIEAAGDLRFGGAAGLIRPIQVGSPFESGGVVHTFELVRGAVATSGITRRSWIDDSGRPAHHVLDPATGRPAFTGIVQATALAPTGVEAEALAKAALLSGPDAGPSWLWHGGVLIYDDGAHQVIKPARGAQA
jgi:FAD:protein FMN transferase